MGLLKIRQNPSVQALFGELWAELGLTWGRLGVDFGRLGADFGTYLEADLGPTLG